VTPILCFPPAGAGASFFAQWRIPVSTGCSLVPVDLPGKEKRYTEEPHRRVSSLVMKLVPELRTAIGDADRVALFGHSFGAVLAYEVACAMAEDAGREVLLVASGSPGPTTQREPRITGRDDEGFLDGVRQFTGYSHPALEDPELRELLLPGLRADIEMHETYEPDMSRVPGFPVIAIRGADEALVSAAAAAEWAAVTSGSFRLEEVPGGHMYLVDRWPEVVGIIQSALLGRVSS
jgi:surfactin synthase thioesterase subunit